MTNPWQGLPARDAADQPWNDDAFAGCKAWLAGWRQTHGAAVNPPKDRHLMTAVGMDAVKLMADGVPRADLCRLMWAAGRDGSLVDANAVSEGA